MRLVQPTDFEILESLADGNRNNAINLAAELDKDRQYLNTRLPVLVDYGLLEKVGPATQSGLYVITDHGINAIEHREQYDDTEDFDALINESTQSEVTDSASH